MTSIEKIPFDRKACAAVIARAESRLNSAISLLDHADQMELRDPLQQIAADLVDSLAPLSAVQIEELSGQTENLVHCIATAGEATVNDRLLSETEFLQSSKQLRISCWMRGNESTEAMLQDLLAAMLPLLTAAIARVCLSSMNREQEKAQRLLGLASSLDSVSHHDFAVTLADYWQADRVWLLSNKNLRGRICALACSSQRDLDADAGLVVQTEAFVQRTMDSSEEDLEVDVASCSDESALHGYASATIYRLAEGQLIGLAMWIDGVGEKKSNFLVTLPDIVARLIRDHQRQVRHHRRLASRLAAATRQPTRWLVALAMISVMVLWPMTIHIRARGRVVANSEQVVFSPVRGQINEVFVRQGETVSAGAPLCELTDPELDLKASELRGEWLTVTEQRQIAESQRGESRSSEKSGTVLADRRVLEVRQRELQKQLDLLDQQRGDLLIHSQTAGVVNWTLSDDGSVPDPGRPIEFGQKLIRIVDRTEGFRIQLQVPDHDIGEVLRHQAAIREDNQEPISLAAEYEIHSEGTRQSATVERISDIAVVNSSDGVSMPGQLVVPVTLKPQEDTKSATQAIMIDASVTGWIDCGRRPAGLVVFRKLIQRLKWTGWL